MNLMNAKESRRGFTPLENASRGPTSIRENADISLPHANKRYSPTGFTLIELLVVIAIIGMLSSVVLTSLNAARTKARDAARQETLKSIQTALEVYYLAHGNYPIGTAFSAWDNYGWNGGVGWGQAFFYALVTEKNISMLARDPINVEGGTGNYLGDNAPTDLSYRYSSDGQGYILGTNLESGSLTANNCGNWQIHGGTATYACP